MYCIIVHIVSWNQFATLISTSSLKQTVKKVFRTKEKSETMLHNKIKEEKHLQKQETVMALGRVCGACVIKQNSQKLL